MKLPVDNAFGLNYNEKDITGRLCIACIRENNCYMLYLDKEENNCDSSEELKTSPFFCSSYKCPDKICSRFPDKETRQININENQTNYFCKVGKKQIDKVICYILRYSTHYIIGKETGLNHPDSSDLDEFERIVKFLMNNGVEINGHSINGLTLLGIACQHGFDGTAQMLLSCGADVEFCNALCVQKWTSQYC